MTAINHLQKETVGESTHEQMDAIGPRLGGAAIQTSLFEPSDSRTCYADAKRSFGLQCGNKRAGHGESFNSRLAALCEIDSVLLARVLRMPSWSERWLLLHC